MDPKTMQRYTKWVELVKKTGAITLHAVMMCAWVAGFWFGCMLVGYLASILMIAMGSGILATFAAVVVAMVGGFLWGSTWFYALEPLVGPFSEDVSHFMGWLQEKWECAKSLKFWNKVAAAESVSSN